MIDELAAAAGMDPLRFRLANLPPDNSRMAAVLRTVAEMADWPRSHRPDRGLGLAGAIYKGETHVAVVAKVTIDRAAQLIRVDHVWCAQDCGLVINPDQVEHQIAGNIVWGCSMALRERMKFEDGRTEASNFDGYDVLRNDGAPEMSMMLIDPAKAEPAGVGESAFGPVAAAIANAIFNATGYRARRLPIAFEDITGENVA
jgi:isoquinoline 1-oxidoreductase beta subunit